MQNYQITTLSFNQSAVVPYRLVKGEIEILLITTRKGRWIIPKGVVEPGLSPAESAAKEAKEEAGALGKLAEKEVGRYAYEKWGGTCRVRVFLLRVTKLLATWEEQSFRRRKWLPLNEAIAIVEDEALRRVLKRVGKVAGK
jgi:8-oxo-dGTP pyrophosphatase MutT (NUDIX family)